MSSVVQCECGSAFNAPANLAGQVVQCPSCGEALRIPGGPGAEAPGLADDGGGSPAGAAKSQATMGGSSMRTGMRRAASEDVRPKTELCPRCRAVHVEAGRLCTSCLYEMHTGQRAGRRGRSRFTVGIGISAAILLLAAGIGGYLVLRTFNAPPPAAQPPTSAGNGNAGEPATITATTTSPQTVTSTDSAIAGPWVAPADAAGTRYEAVKRTDVEAVWDPETGVPSFVAAMLPSQVGEALNMGTRVTLYRAADEAGPFEPVARATPSEIDPATRALVFKLSDAKVLQAGLNQAFYRLSGADDDGLRLFDTPPAEFRVLSPPRIDGGRLRWSPTGTASDIKPLQCVLTLAAPGWEQVALGQVTLSGPTDVALPGGTTGLPVRATLAITWPTRVSIPSGGSAPWRRTTRVHHYGGPGESTELTGIVPTWTRAGLSYALLPGADAFSGLSEARTAAGGVQLTFRAGSQTAPQLLELPAVPGLTSLRATPFDRSIRLTWNAAGLRDAAKAFEGPVQLAVFRTGTDAVRELVATLDLNQSTYTDRQVEAGAAYRYEVRLTSAADPNVAAMLPTQAWIAGHGRVPVLTPVAPSAVIASVSPEPGLTQLHLSLGQSELCYPNTDRAAMAVMDALRQAVADHEGMTLIERGALERAFGPGAGAAAHVELTVIDAMTPQGPAVELWAADLVTDQRIRLCTLPIATALAEPDEAAEAMMAQVQPRLPAGAPHDVPAAEAKPTSILLTPLLPLDQPRRSYGSAALERDLLQQALRRGSDVPVTPLSFHRGGDDATVGTFGAGGFAPTQTAAVLLSGRTWTDDGGATGVAIHAIDASSGELLTTFREAKVNAHTPTRFVDWCETLRVKDAASALLTDFGDRPSPLREAERALGPIHPVWRAMTGDNDDADQRPALVAPMAPLGDAVTLVMGLPLPAALRPFEPARQRDPNDPLTVIRPYIASVLPATFEQWAVDYAQYVKDDFEAFARGLADAAAAMRRTSGPFKPRLIVRGEDRFTGGAALSGPVTASDNPVILNVRGFFPLGASGQPLVRYRPPLDDLFRRRPWAAYHAWKQAPPSLAEAFLKGVLLGVENDNYGHADTTFRLAPPLHQYIAASLLADLGSGAGENYRRRAVEVSTQTLRELIERDPRTLTRRQSLYVSRALLILLFENDPAVVQMLRDPRRMELYIHAEPLQAADTLRLLVDRVGPTAWQWAAAQPGLDWNAFLWRSADEMRMVTDAMPNALPDALYAHVRESLDAPLAPRAPHPQRHRVHRQVPARPVPGQ